MNLNATVIGQSIAFALFAYFCMKVVGHLWLLCFKSVARKLSTDSKPQSAHKLISQPRKIRQAKTKKSQNVKQLK